MEIQSLSASLREKLTQAIDRGFLAMSLYNISRLPYDSSLISISRGFNRSIVDLIVF